MWENSIIDKIKFVTKAYEDLIKAQGIDVKWERASRCGCYKVDLGEADYKCPLCRGKGYTYLSPSDVKAVNERATILSNNRLRVINNPTSITRVYNKAQDLTYTVNSIAGNEIILNEASLQGHYGVFVDYQYSLLYTTTETTYVTQYNKDEIRVSKRYIQEISSIHNDTQDIEYTSLYNTDDMIKLNAPALISDVITVTYTYIKPIKIVMTEAKTDETSFQGIGELVEGDSKLTFMPWFNISMRDRITVLDNDVSMRESEILTKGVADVLKSDNVIRILHVQDELREYTEGVDFTITGTHSIKWIDGGNAPAFKEHYSVLYLARREYIIWKSLYFERHHGNVLLPRKVVARKIQRYNFAQDASFPNGG